MRCQYCGSDEHPSHQCSDMPPPVETEAKHSTLPWHTGGIFNPTSPQPTVNIWTEAKPGNASGNIVAERVPIKEAEFIVLATSLHAELVAALESTSLMLEDAQSGFISGSGSDEAWDETRTALVLSNRAILQKARQK